MGGEGRGGELESPKRKLQVSSDPVLPPPSNLLGGKGNGGKEGRGGELVRLKSKFCDPLFLRHPTSQVVPLPGPSSSSHPGMDHLPLSTPTLTPGQKVTITPHDPQLPVGPNPFVGFHMPFPPMTPLSAGTPGVGHESLFVRPVDSATVVALREHEQQQQQLALWQQQQQQQWLQALHQQQKQLHELQSQFTPHIPPPHTNTPHPATTAPHPMPAHLPFAPGVSHAHPPQHSHSRPHPHSVEASSSQPVAFNFPTPEEMMRHRLAQMGLPPEAITMGILPPGIPLDHTHIAKLEEQHHQQQQQAALAAAMGMHLVPGMPHVNMELLIQQQHQQQAALAAAQAASGMSPVIAPTAENILEFQRQFEAVMLQVQKEPQLLQVPYVQQMIQQQRLLAMHMQGAPMQEQNYQQRVQEMLMQQHEMQKHFAGVVRPAHEETHGRGVGRPPVIVQPK